MGSKISEEPTDAYSGWQSEGSRFLQNVVTYLTYQTTQQLPEDSNLDINASDNLSVTEH
jgi:hypothetical protein